MKAFATIGLFVFLAIWIAVVPTTASAGTAEVDVASGVLSYVAGSHEVNHLQVNVSNGVYTLRDYPGATAGAGCTQAAPRVVTCTGSISSVSVDVGDLNDVVSVSVAVPVTIQGGPGPDAITNTGTTTGTSFIFGGPGADHIDGGTNATVDGGPGPDNMDVFGGTIDYSTRSQPVSITQDGVANDGVPGEGDNAGGGFTEALGGSKADTIEWAHGFVYGGAGDDQLDSTHNAVLHGGAGNDRLTTTGQGALFGESGDDTLTSQNGVQNRDICGFGSDDAFVDGFDLVSPSCEVVQTAV